MSLGKRALTWPLTHALLTGVIAVYRWGVAATVRWRVAPSLHRLLRTRQPVLFAIWHQDFLTTCGWLARYSKRRKTYALASTSRDGELATTLAKAVGLRDMVRGSSAKGGSKALLQLHRTLAAEPQASALIVCDGPRPPARVLQPGLLHLASATGRPIWLLRTSYHPCIEFSRSWARFRLPCWGGWAVNLCDGPIWVPAGLSRAELERLRVHVERRLNALADRADAWVLNWR